MYPTISNHEKMRDDTAEVTQWGSVLRQWGVLLLLQAAGYFGQFDRTIFGMAVPQIQSYLDDIDWLRISFGK